MSESSWLRPKGHITPGLKPEMAGQCLKEAIKAAITDRLVEQHESLAGRAPTSCQCRILAVR